MPQEVIDRVNKFGLGNDQPELLTFFDCQGDFVGDAIRDINNFETTVIVKYDNCDNVTDEFARENDFIVELNAESTIDNLDETHTSEDAENNFDRELVDENLHKSTQDTNVENSEGVTVISPVAPEIENVPIQQST